MTLVIIRGLIRDILFYKRIWNNMVSHMNERMRIVTNEIIECYNQLRKYETDGCTLDELRKALIDTRNSAEELPSLLALMLKENPSQTEAVKELAKIFKVPFLSTLRVHILSMANMPTDIDSNWIKTQANMAVTYINFDGYIDSLRIMSSFLH
jgi:uncharacterized pyridoxamine 5'-phosphate oxidase family protein